MQPWNSHFTSCPLSVYWKPHPSSPPLAPLIIGILILLRSLGGSCTPGYSNTYYPVCVCVGVCVCVCVCVTCAVYWKQYIPSLHPGLIITHVLKLLATWILVLPRNLLRTKGQRIEVSDWATVCGGVHCPCVSLDPTDYENLAHVAHPGNGDYSNLQY